MFLCQEKMGRGVSHLLRTKGGDQVSSQLGVIPPYLQEAFRNVWLSQKLEGAVGIYRQCGEEGVAKGTGVPVCELYRGWYMGAAGP